MVVRLMAARMNEKSTKKVFKFFTVAEYEQEQEYLRKQNKLGWKLINVKGIGCYIFEKCEPEDVVYQLDYNQDSKDDMGEYIQMFRDCGWEYLCDYVGYSYFRKPISKMQKEEEIFNDNHSKLDMIDRVFKRRILPLLAIFFLILCPNLLKLRSDVTSLTDPLEKVIFGLYCGLFAIYVIVFGKWIIMYRRLKQKK